MRLREVFWEEWLCCEVEVLKLKKCRCSVQYITVLSDIGYSTFCIVSIRWWLLSLQLLGTKPYTRQLPILLAHGK